MTDNKIGENRKPNNGAGRPKGAANIVTAEIKDMVRGALDAVGGIDYLTNQAKENPVAFMGLIKAIIPKDVNATLNGDLRISSIKRVIIDPTDNTDSESL